MIVIFNGCGTDKKSILEDFKERIRKSPKSTDSPTSVVSHHELSDFQKACNYLKINKHLPDDQKICIKSEMKNIFKNLLLITLFYKIDTENNYEQVSESFKIIFPNQSCDFKKVEKKFRKTFPQDQIPEGDDNQNTIAIMMKSLIVKEFEILGNHYKACRE